MRAWLLSGLAVAILCLSVVAVFRYGERWASEPDPKTLLMEAVAKHPQDADALVKRYPGVARELVPDFWRRYFTARLEPVEGRKSRVELEYAFVLTRAIEHELDDPSYLESTRKYRTLSGLEIGEKTQADEAIGRAESEYREGDLTSARNDTTSALEIYRSLEDHWSELRALHLLGNIEWVAGNTDRAGAYYRALAEAARLQGNREREASALNNLARIEEARGKLREAAQGYRNVRDLGERHGIPRITAFALLYLGNLYHRLGLHERAVDYFGRAETIFGGQKNSAMEAVAASNRGASLQLLEDFEEAVAAYERSLALRTNERQRASTRLHLAELHFKEGASERALDSLEKILLLTQDAQDVESKRLRWGALVTDFDIHLSAGRTDSARQALEEAESLAKDIHQALDQVETSRRRARLSREEGDVDRAVKELQTAVGIVEELRASPEAEEERVRFLSAQEAVYTDLAEIQLRELNQPLEAYRISEQSRSRAFLDSLQGRARLSSDEPGTIKVILPSSAEPETVENVVSSLPRDGALIHYTVGAGWLAVLAFDRNGLRRWEVLDVDGADLRRTARRFSEAASKPESEQPDASAARLAEWLLAPVAGVLEAHPTLVIVPDDVLFELPWSALPWKGGYLVEDHRLVIEPSASVFVRLWGRRLRPEAATVLLVANPSTRVVDGEPRLDNLRDSAVPYVRPLPETEIEAAEIGALLGGAEILAREEATEPAVSAAMSRHDRIHLGTHARIVADRPLASSLLLAGGAISVDEARLEPISPADGVLTGYEVLEMDLKPGAMVTLAACESAGRAGRQGEGVAGLARAFFEAGAGTIVGSLWAVEDLATRRLMVRFYEHLSRRKASTAGSLSEAQSAMARGEEGDSRRHPYYWAGFILIGDGR